jgi:hypothetical protein
MLVRLASSWMGGPSIRCCMEERNNRLRLVHWRPFLPCYLTPATCICHLLQVEHELLHLLVLLDVKRSLPAAAGKDAPVGPPSLDGMPPLLRCTVGDAGAHLTAGPPTCLPRPAVPAGAVVAFSCVAAPGQQPLSTCGPADWSRYPHPPLHTSTHPTLWCRRCGIAVGAQGRCLAQGSDGRPAPPAQGKHAVAGCWPAPPLGSAAGLCKAAACLWGQPLCVDHVLLPVILFKS